MRTAHHERTRSRGRTQTCNLLNVVSLYSIHLTASTYASINSATRLSKMLRGACAPVNIFNTKQKHQ